MQQGPNKRTNSEGYADRTAYRAAAKIASEQEIVSIIVREIKDLAEDYGFDLVNRIVLKNRRNGRVWR